VTLLKARTGLDLCRTWLGGRWRRRPAGRV